MLSRKSTAAASPSIITSGPAQQQPLSAASDLFLVYPQHLLACSWCRIRASADQVHTATARNTQRDRAPSHQLALLLAPAWPPPALLLAPAPAVPQMAWRQLAGQQCQRRPSERWQRPRATSKTCTRCSIKTSRSDMPGRGDSSRLKAARPLGQAARASTATGAGTAYPLVFSVLGPAPTTQQETCQNPTAAACLCCSMAHMRSAELAQHSSGTCSCMQQGTDRGR